MVEPLIARLDAWCRENRPEFYETLLPGLTAPQLDDLGAQLGLTLPDDFRALYSWRNGQSLSYEQQHFKYSFDFEGRFLMSAEHITAIWNHMPIWTQSILYDELPPGFVDSTDWWNPKWIPLLDNWSGDAVCLDTYGSYGGKVGQLVEYIHDADDRPVEYSSVEAWLRMLVSMLETGGKSWDEWHDEDISLYLLPFKMQYDPGYPKFFPPHESSQNVVGRLYTPFQ